MRVSIQPHDSGYLLWRQILAAGNAVHVKFNGATEHGALTADSEAGLIIRYKRNATGGITYDAERQALLDEVLHGRVEIEIHKRRVL